MLISDGVLDFFFCFIIKSTKNVISKFRESFLQFNKKQLKLFEFTTFKAFIQKCY